MIWDMMWWTFVGDIYVDLCGEYGRVRLMPNSHQIGIT